MSNENIDLGLGASVHTPTMNLPTVSEVLNHELAVADEQLAVCINDFDLSGMQLNDLLSFGIDELNASMMKLCRAGAAFWAAQEAIKNASPLGGLVTFQEFMDKNGLPKQRVYEAISIAKCYTRLPEEQRTKLITVGKKKALLLAKLPQAEIERMAESGIDVLDAAEMQTYDQLRDLLKLEQRKNKQMGAELEHRDALIDKLKARQPNWQFLPKTHVVREECLAYQAECEVAMNSLQALFEDCVNDDTETEKTMRIEQVWITAQVVAARSADLLGKLKAYGLALPESINSQHSLTDDEAERWLLDYPLVERKHFAAKAKREDQRPKGPGRPKADK